MKNKFFKWIYKPNGNCPVQSEGWFLGYYFYFRARWSTATIEFYRDKWDFELLNNPVAEYDLKETEEYKAGWLSKRICTFLIYKGCLKFLVKRLT
jgi:hypothetical protein